MRLLLVFLVCASFASNGVGQEGHATGCGCTTTTTCGPAHESQSCPPSLVRPGKQGPKGSKGSKGEASQVTNEMQTKVERLERDVHELKALQDAYFSGPSTCASYHSRDIADENLRRVPLEIQSSGNLILSNCTKIPEIRETPSFPHRIPVPRNSIRGRTFILEGTPRRPHPFEVNFIADDPTRYFLHMAVRLQGSKPHVVWNSSNGQWRPNPKTEYPGPFTFDVSFRLVITIDDVGFHGFLDGEDIFTFNHQEQPLIDVNRIQITGYLEVSLLSFN